MAKTYLDIQNSAYTVGNIMDWTNALTRLSGVPVDITEVYDSYDKAVEYAATNPVAYEGQLITVTENGDTTVYVITPAIQGTHKVTVGEETTTYNVNIKKVGTVPSGDNASITVTDAGLVSIFGFAGAQDGMLPVREDGKLVWKTLEAIGAGDGNDNTTYEFALTESKTGIVVTPYFNGQPIMEGEEGAQTQKKFELVLDVYTKAEADEKFLAKADYVPYDDSDLQGRVKAIEDDYLKTEDKYDDTALAARVKALEDEERYDETALANRVTANEEAIVALGEAIDGVSDAVAAEKERAEAAEAELLEKINAIDFIDADELAAELEPYALSTEVETALADKADKTDLEDLKGRVDAFFEGTGVENVVDTLEDLINFINTHDDTDINGILASIQALENKVDTGDKTVSAYVTAAIEAIKIGDYAKAADLTALAGRVEVLEAKPFNTYATKSEVEAVDSRFANYTTTEALNTQLADKADANSVVANDTFAQFQTDNAEAIAAARSGAVADVANVGYALADNVAGTYATKGELSQHATDMEATIEATLKDYATVASVNVELAKKIESAKVYHADDERSENVYLDGTHIDIVIDAPTRAQTAQMIADSIKDVAGEDSIPAVKADLEAEITRSTNQDAAHTSAITALQTAVDEAKAQADKGVADAKAANDTITELTTGVIANNTSDITTIKGRLSTLESAKGDHEQRITSVEGKVNALEAADLVINSTLTDHGTEIAGLKTKDAELLAAINANTAKFDGYYTKSEVDTKVQEAIDAIPDVDFTGYATETFVTEAITVVNAEIATKANAAEVYTKTEADAKFMTETQVKAAMDKVVADVSDQDTIEGLVTLVEYVHDNAGDIAKLVSDVENNGKAINANVTAIAANKAAHEQNASDIVTLTATVAAQKVVESAEVSTTAADDGIQLGIKEVNVNKLVQTTGDILILNGGTAQA